ncbi:MAG: response regulator [Phycisphaerae bacterium]|jgi:CheY-like chemotaxis protein
MKDNLSTFAIAELLHVDPGSIANWIDQDILKAYRTPGGHRRVQVGDLLNFLHQHKMPVPPELNCHPHRVLIVDDEPGITQLVAKTIKTSYPEVEVLEANDGFLAGALVATLKPNVVILDLRMPGMDGFEVCRLIKSQDQTKNIDVVAMTAFPSPDSEKSILSCGARVCLSKPLDMGVLLKELRTSFSA